MFYFTTNESKERCIAVHNNSILRTDWLYEHLVEEPVWYVQVDLHFDHLCWSIHQELSNSVKYGSGYLLDLLV